MVADELLSRLRGQGVRVWVDGDRLRCEAPANILTPDLLEQLRTNKASVMNLLNGPSSAMKSQSRLQPVSRERDLPLSFAQERLWFLDQLQPLSAAYSMPMRLRVDGELNAEVLRRSLEEMTRRHEILRTCFVDGAGRPLQVITSHATFEMPVTDLSGLVETERLGVVKRMCAVEAARPFDVKRDLMLRAHLFHLGPTTHVLFLNIHHIASDGWSNAILLRETKILYDAFLAGNPSPLTDLSIQYADFAAWQRDFVQGELLEKQLRYWKSKMDGAPALLDLPRERARPNVQSARGAVETKIFSGSLLSGLRNLSHQEGTSLFMTLLAAFQTLLCRYTGQEDIVVGSPIATRNPTELEGLIGLLVNTLPLRTDLTGNPTFRELLQRVKETSLGAIAHQDLPFERLVEELQPERDLSHAPLFQIFFAFQNMPAKRDELSSNLELVTTGTSKFDLSLYMIEEAKDLRTEVEYCPDLFGKDMIVSMLNHLNVLLEAVVADPCLHIKDLPLLGASERQLLLKGWNQTAVDYPRHVRIEQLFEEQVQKTPHKTALIFNDRQMNYQDLDRQADRLAQHLQDCGVKPGVMVALYVQRSLNMVVGLLAILKAGGAYIPLDPIYPSERIALMLDDAQPLVLLTQVELRDRVIQHGIEIVCFDDLPRLQKVSRSLDRGACTADDIAYIIYTSGSTGVPKGVKVSHRGVVNFLTSMRREPGMVPEDVLLAVTTISFDIAVLELFLPLITGAEVVIADADVVGDGIRLGDLMIRHGVTFMQATPATWRLLLDAGWRGSPHLKLLCGGEAWPMALARELLARCQSLWNMYGPTETTVWSAACKVEAEQPIRIGRPIANTRFYVLQDGFQPAPPWAPGELFIGGDSVALGYLNRTELTDERFIADPFTPGARLYKTGDIVRYLPDGHIDFLGRADHQIKIRGFRIELDEIANVLLRHPNVEDAVLLVEDDERADKRIVAYVTPAEGSAVAGELKDFLLHKLPGYMVPSAFVFLETFPLTPNGKIDRKALPALGPQTTLSESIYAPPSTPTELSLVKIWRGILKVEKIGRHDDFFELGGHSLMITRLIYEVNKTHNVTLGIPELFRNPTVQKLAAVVDQQAPETARLPNVVLLQEGGSELPVYFIYAGPDEFRLAQLMGEKHAVFGVEAPWPLTWRSAVTSNRTSKFPTMDELVASFVEALKAHTGTSPCVLAGHSFAGLIAFEAAHQFQKQGGKIELVIIVDKWASNPIPYQVALQNLQDCWRRPNPSGTEKAFASSVLSRLKVSCFIAWWFLKQEKSRLRLRLNLPLSDPRQMTAMLDEKGMPLHWGLLERLYARLEKSYKPRSLDCRGILFRTDFMDDKKSVRVTDTSLGWNNLFTGGLEIIPVIGDHLSMIREHNQSLGRKIHEVLQRHASNEGD